MSGIARLTKQGVANSPRKGFWVHAGDLNQKIEQGQFREAALQQCLTAADDRLDAGISFVTRMIKCAGGQPSIATSYLRDILDKLKPAEDQPLTTCTWSSHEFSWSSNCGMNGWEFTDGGVPAENGMRFCHSRGKPLVVDEDQPESERES